MMKLNLEPTNHTTLFFVQDSVQGLSWKISPELTATTQGKHFPRGNKSINPLEECVTKFMFLCLI